MSEEEIRRAWEEHPTLRPKIAKVVVNISVGKSGEPLEKAIKVLKELTGQTPCKRNARKSIRDFGIRQGEPIACLVTLRNQGAIEFLNRVLPAIENRLPKGHFDRRGNFAFGIKEHIEIPGVKYDPEVGIFGMDVCVSLTRAGYRVKERRIARTKIGSKHVLTPEEAMVFAKQALGIEVA